MELDDEVRVRPLRPDVPQLIVPSLHDLADDLRDAVPALGAIALDLPGPLELLLGLEPDADVEGGPEAGVVEREQPADDDDVARRTRSIGPNVPVPWS